MPTERSSKRARRDPISPPRSLALSKGSSSRANPKGKAAEEALEVEQSSAGSSEEETSTSQINLAKAATKLHYAAKSLRATAKKAKTFEVQRLVKKSKDTRKDGSKAAEQALIAEELDCLKELDTNFWAGRVLITKMTKARLLPKQGTDEQSSVFPYLQMVQDEVMLGQDVLAEPKPPASVTKAFERAKAKLISSKLLADQVGKFVDGLKILVGIETITPQTKIEPTKLAAAVKGKSKAIEQPADETREWSGSEEEFASDNVAAFISDGEDDDESGDEQKLARIGKQKLAALGDLSQWDNMIGSDSEALKHAAEDSNDSAMSSEGEADFESDDSDSDDSDSEDDYSSNASSLDVNKRKRNESNGTAKKRTKTTSAGSSAFLPSLSHGFIVGDRSDDDWSDAEADLADRDMSELKKGAKKERKNRMGQRARKAIYEKKYGKNANHLKLMEKEKQPRKETSNQGIVSKNGRVRPPAFEAPQLTDAGWGKAVAPTSKPAKTPPIKPRSNTVSTRPQPTSLEANRHAGKNGGTAKDQEMHPSWIAKQKQKELMAQVKPSGKKIVFD